MAELPATLLCRLLRAPEHAVSIPPADWSALLRAARREGLAGSLAERLRQAGLWPVLPAQVRAVLGDAEIAVARSHVVARWEMRKARAALAPLGCPIIALKGTAYVLAGLKAGRGRSAGDLDILIPRSYLGAAEIQLQEAGWSYVHTDPYDLHYYRAWMHELPPMVHRERGTELDVHHTILPLTARATPDAAAMIAEARPVEGLPVRVLAPADMVLHSAAHLFHAGDLVKPLRNLWDIHLLLEEFGTDPAFWPALVERARRHGLLPILAYSVRYAGRLFGTITPADFAAAVAAALPPKPLRMVMDILFMTLFRHAGSTDDSWRLRAARGLLTFRSHWLKMPPALLARHLWTKWRRKKG